MHIYPHEYKFVLGRNITDSGFILFHRKMNYYNIFQSVVFFVHLFCLFFCRNDGRTESTKVSELLFTFVMPTPM